MVRNVICVGLLCSVLTSGIAFGQGFSPKVAVERMTVADGLRATLFASEPNVRQPIFVKCDDRGRLWTIQYLQYPNPAGLERVEVDRWSRTVYDRVPKPPPHGPRGADRITICHDTNGDGRADRFIDFLDGLNLVTGVAFGHGGVFVLNVPYLLFYPDRNRDDVPDADPQVLLTGFGMEDAQSLSNHLTWGPDGWLYGVNGSTTTCRIRGVEFQQGVWRYHPRTRDFELFCEGGSNCYGITFDANGELYYSTNGGPFVHAVQGGYFYKSFGKHGPLHNLYAYHYFPPLDCDDVPGGPPTGGTIYAADAFPDAMHESFIAGNFLGHTASWWHVIPEGSTVRATLAGRLLDSHDTWFGPTDMCLGPDGAMYVSDFHDERTAHPDPDANWDRTNGRIFRIEAVDAVPARQIEVGQLNSCELVDLLGHRNRWFADRARVELASRQDSRVAERLRNMASQSKDNRLALEGLWALYGVTGIDDLLTLELLSHPYKYVRYWTVRLIGDKRTASPAVAKRLAALADSESSVIVRGQLAASAKRLPGPTGLKIVNALLENFPHESDARIPWLIWWAIESKALTDTAAIVDMFTAKASWQNPAARANGLRLVRRYAAEGTHDGYNACAALLDAVPPDYTASALNHLRQGLAERSVGLHGIGQGGLFGAQAAAAEGEPDSKKRDFESVGGKLQHFVAQYWQEENSATTLELALRAELPGSRAALASAAFAPLLPQDERIALLALVREFGSVEDLPRALKLIAAENPESVQLAAVDVVAEYVDESVTSSLLHSYAQLSTAVQSRIGEMLLSRGTSARTLLEHIDRGEIDRDSIAVEQLRRLALYDDDKINELVLKHWGNVGPGSSEEKLATMRRYNNDLRPGGGDPARGKVLFAQHCGVCHEFHGEGNRIGPDLTTANRHDRAALLANLVDPSAVVRREYISYVVITDSGQVHVGLLAEQDGATVTVLDAKNQRKRISREEIVDMHPSETSLMPERLLEKLTPHELRDLFAYLQK